MAAIFISHSSRDNEAAAALTARLREAGLSSLFLDFDPDDGIDAGARWEQTLYARLRQCHAVVVVLTPAWLESRWCFAEAVQAREKGKAIVPVLTEPCDLPAILADFQAVSWLERDDEALRRLVAGLEAIGLGAGRAGQIDPNQAPYPGMAACDEPQAGLFFGRDEETRALRESLESLRRHGSAAPRLIVVLGASGSGKSSLVRAGLLPSLRADPGSWIVVPALRPLGDPFGELAAALERAWQALRPPATESLPTDGLLSGDPVARAEAIVRAVNTLRHRTDAGGASVLLTVDQAEELLAPGAACTCEGFLTALRLALELEREGGRLLALATLRSDFLGAFQTHHAVKRTTAAGELAYLPFTVEPMPTRRFAEVIRGPARIVGLELDDGLVEQLVADAEVPDALPILAFTLRQLYDRFGRKTHRITLADYAALGRLEGAVRVEANRILEVLQPSPAERDALRAAFVPRLAQVSADGTYTRRRARRSDMPDAAARLIGAFVDARLLVSDRDRDGDETVEISHEALLRVWPLLRDWLDADRARLQLLASIQHAAAQWRRAGEAEDLLVHRKGRLADAVELDRDARFRLPEGSDERAYLQACVARETALERRARRRRRIAFAMVLAAALGFAGLAGVAYQLKAQAQKERAVAVAQRDAALRAASARDVVQATRARERGELIEAIAFARRALAGEGESGPPPYTYAAAASLFDALAAYRHLDRVIPMPAELGLTWLDGDARLLGVSRHGWWVADLATGRIVLEQETPVGYGLVLSANRGTALALGPPLRAWRVAPGEPVAVDPDGRVADHGPMSADLSRDGRFAVLGTQSGTVFSLDLDAGGRPRGPVLRLPEATTGYVHAVRLSPDATRLVAIQSDKIWVHAYEEGRIGARLADIDIVGGERLSSSEALKPAFIGQSALLAMPLEDELRLIDVSSGQVVAREPVASRAGGGPRTSEAWTLEAGALLIDGIASLPRIASHPAQAAALHQAALDLEAAGAPVSWSSRIRGDLAGGRVADLHEHLGLPRDWSIDWPTDWPLGIVAGRRSDNMIAFGAGYRALLRHEGVAVAALANDAQLAATAGPKQTLLWRFDGRAGRTLFAPRPDRACSARVLDAVCRPDAAVILTSEPLARRALESCVLHARSGNTVPLPDVTYVMGQPGFLSDDGSRAVLRTDNRGGIGVFDTVTGEAVDDAVLAQQGTRQLVTGAVRPPDETPAENARVRIADGVLSFAVGDGSETVRWEPPGLAAELVIDASGTMALTRSDTAIEVWNIADGRLLERIGVPGAHCVTFSPAGAVRAVVQGGAWVEWKRPERNAEARLLELARRVESL